MTKRNTTNNSTNNLTKNKDSRELVVLVGFCG